MSSKIRQRFDKRPKPKSADSQIAAQVQSKFQQAFIWHQQGQLVQAQILYEEILKAKPKHLDALHMLGVIAAQTNNLQRAVALFSKAIEINPNNATFYFNRGLARQELKQLDAALADYNKAIAIEHDSADVYFNRGNTLRELKQLNAALADYDRAIALAPAYAEAHYNRGLALYELKQLEAALACYRKAIAIKPDYAEAYHDLGDVLHELKQLDAALACYDQTIALRPDSAEAYNGRGNALYGLKQFGAALTSYDKAIALKPDFELAYCNRGNLLRELQQYQAAFENYDKALAIKPDCAAAYRDAGNLLCELKQYQAAIESYNKALAIKPDYEFLFGVRLHIKMQICDWSDVENQLAELINKIQRNEKASTPFPVLALSTSLTLQRKAAEIWVNDKSPQNNSLGKINKPPKHEKIRIGYFSMDFRNHPVSFLMVELFESHDRNKFEVIGFSFGPDTQDEMRQRLEGTFDKFIDVRRKSDKEIAEMVRLMEIDIAIDLAGFTADSRAGIFAHRAAPVQVNFLGYPGTMGAGYMDYLIADKQVVPTGNRDHYSEKIVDLPNFQPNDSKRKISDRVFTREELALPESGFVFCCFNTNYKITPRTFDGWMRILKRVEGSVLWLAESNVTAANNLRQEAAQRGVDAQRLVFAPKMPLLADHLARYRAADLFIDTLPYNAHTTASDALWVGLPVLTCMGEAFASRVAASLLTAMDVPELIVRTQEEYENLAVELATNPEHFKAIKLQLERNRLGTPLFNSMLFTKHIEDAYAQMYERYHADLPPDHIHVKL